MEGKTLIFEQHSHEELVVGKEALDIMHEDTLSRQLYMLLRDGKRC